MALGDGGAIHGLPEAPIFGDARITKDGGLAVKMVNKTGAASIRGQVVKADTATDNGVILCAANDDEGFGVLLDSGIAANANVWVVTSGFAYVALEDNVASVHGYWVGTGAAEAGYARTQAAPPALGVAAHFEEVGHCIESVAAGGAGTHILAKCVIHFN
jgi:hypothetical protein